MNNYSVQATVTDNNGNKIKATIYNNMPEYEARRLAKLCNGTVIPKLKTK